MDRGASPPTMALMETKKKAAAAVVTEGEAQAALRRGGGRELTAEEERVLRMHLGATPTRTAPLERTVEPLSDLEIEVRAMEIEAYLKWRDRQGPAARPLPRPSATSRTKEKIVRALRRK